MNTENRISNYLDKWIVFVMSHALWVVLFFVVLAISSIYYTVTHIGINTKTDDMLSKDLPYRQIRKDYFKSFPYHSKIIVLVISGHSTLELQKSSRELADKLRQQDTFFKKVYIPGNDPYFFSRQLLYLENNNFQNFEQDLNSSKPFLTQLIKAPDTSSLISNLAQANNSSNTIINSILEQTIHVIDAQQSDQTPAVNWNLVFSANVTNVNSVGKQTNIVKQFILIEPTDKYREVLAAGNALKLIRKTARQLNIDQQLDFELRITGLLAMSYEELNSVSKGMGFAGIMALLLVVLLLWFGSRSFKILLFSLITLLIGLSLTAGFAALSIGSLNLISVAFAVLYIGLGIDFSIHLCLRYQELLHQKNTSDQALRTTTRDVGSSLVICAVSTAIGFYAFIPTNFVGLSELGTISGTGMFISLIVSLSLLPALFKLSPLAINSSDSTNKTRLISQAAWLYLSSVLQKYQRLIMLILVVVTTGSVFVATESYFDYDLLNMRDQSSESVATFRELVKNKENSPLHLSVIVNDLQLLQKLQQQLSELSTVKKVSSIINYIPDNQQQRLSQLKLLQQSMSAVLHSRAGSTKASTLFSLQQSLDKLDKTRNSKLYRSLSELILKLNKLDSLQRKKVLLKLDESILGSFPGSLLYLQKTLSPNKVTLENLPADDRRHWISTITQRYLLQVYPKNSIYDVKQLREFVNQVSTIAPNVTDTPAITLAAGDVAVSAFKQALLTALVLITLLLLFIYKNIIDTFLVLSPLLLAALFTTAVAVLLNIPFNFSNIIAIPLLFGIGVDNGIHMISRSRSGVSNHFHLLHTSTTRAVVLSAFTTIASFGNLGYSSHPGTASMGQLLTIGVVLTLFSTLLILPVLLANFKKN
ncbi:MAG: MMPL family transporter [Thiohalomonadales bacterium]